MMGFTYRLGVLLEGIQVERQGSLVLVRSKGGCHSAGSHDAQNSLAD